MQFSDITGHTERVYPTRLKVCRTVVSWIVSAIFLALSIAGQWATVFYEADLVSTFHVQADSEAVLFLVRCKPGLINGVLQMVLWSLYGRVASRSGKSVQRGRALQAAHSSCEHPPHPPVPEEGARTHCHWQSDRECPCVEETSTNTTLRTEEEGAVKNFGRRPVALQHPNTRYGPDEPRPTTCGAEGEERKVEEEGQAVHQNDCGATRADAGAAGEAEGVQEYENEYNKRMSEVEFEQSKGKYDYVQQSPSSLRSRPLVPRGSHQRRARHPLRAVQAAQHKATPDPVDSPKHVVDGNVDHDDHLGLHPAHHTRAVLLFPRQADRPLHGGYTPTTADNAAFVFFIQFLAALALENLFLAVRAAIALSTASAQIDTEFGAIKLKVGFILIFDDIIGLKMQQSIYLRSEAYPSISTHPY
ncbi:hypothetical protein BLNAU_25008 [Blattamonas nauphoetae]|uniref:Transmembrane protein n=1 Tax=Blattamonas nauphoetae TaxID=2049346 RepID=A0ABQ9WKU1_9EUKA|nr:hypothetical protein BLNAU_25008 [Blattamonas nauphoetae]